ncbi:uncharacterized protein [Dermacentor albipictus]|uniref:uncharacterized protein isoform X3 n=1 Tax=Dermacentor albipictus TaxID=60249 RepID=UPI0038FD08FF
MAFKIFSNLRTPLLHLECATKVLIYFSMLQLLCHFWKVVFRLRTPSTRKDPKRPAVQTCEAAFTGKADQQRSVRLAS